MSLVSLRQLVQSNEDLRLSGINRHVSQMEMMEEVTLSLMTRNKEQSLAFHRVAYIKTGVDITAKIEEYTSDKFCSYNIISHISPSSQILRYTETK